MRGCACAKQKDTGGAEGDRTPDLVIANDALSQLSYGPVPVSGAEQAPREERAPYRKGRTVGSANMCVSARLVGRPLLTGHRLHDGC